MALQQMDHIHYNERFISAAINLIIFIKKCTVKITFITYLVTFVTLVKYNF